MSWRKKRSLEDFKEEIDSHLAHEADQIRDTGTCADPDAAARRAFGSNVTTAQEACYEHEHWMFFDHLTRDLRQAVRQLKRASYRDVRIPLRIATMISSCPSC
jgi:hypothetical protein